MGKSRNFLMNCNLEGDIPEQVESMLKQNFKPNMLKAEILKIDKIKHKLPDYAK